MPQAPSVAELVEQFKLKERGHDRGRSEHPSSDSPRLDAPETEVIAHCEHLFTERLADYNRHRTNFEERMRPPSGTAGGDADVEQACLDLREAVEEERTELEGLRRTAQQAIGDLHQFKKEEGLNNRDAHYSENRILDFGILLVVMAAETALNGVLFAANVSGGMITGWTYAAGISLANVGVLGAATAFFLRKTKHRVPIQKMVGWTVLALIAVVAIALNLFVGHYREALSEDYPPAPDTLAAVPAAETAQPGIEACWRGPDEADANQEALCLLLHNPVRLGGFLPYLLFFFGLAAWLFGAYKWFNRDDEYPGYGTRDRRRRKAEEKLTDERSELIEGLKRIHDAAQAKLVRDFTDPADARKLALSAFDNLKRRHRDVRDFTKSLAASVRGSLDIYRTNNEETRTKPRPGIWMVPWEADWRLPDPPDLAGVITEDEATKRSRLERTALEDRQARLRSCLEKQQEIVNGFTKLDHYDRAGPP